MDDVIWYYMRWIDGEYYYDKGGGRGINFVLDENEK